MTITVVYFSLRVDIWKYANFFVSYLKSNTFHLSVFTPYFMARSCKHPLASLRITKSRFESAKVGPSLLVIRLNTPRSKHLILALSKN